MSKLVALVTGSNRGIGKSCILEFARAGINVVINYCHRKEEAEALKQEIEEKYKVEVLVVKCDVSKEDEVEAMVNQIVDYFGGIDILVNNAGVCRVRLLILVVLMQLILIILKVVTTMLLKQELFL